MPGTGMPSSSSSGSRRGAPSAYTDAGPPLRISPFGARRITSSAPTWGGSSSPKTPPSRRPPHHLVGADGVGQQLAEDAALAHAPGDELRVLAAVIEDDDLVEPA